MVNNAVVEGGKIMKVGDNTTVETKGSCVECAKPGSCLLHDYAQCFALDRLHILGKICLACGRMSLSVCHSLFIYSCP